MATPWSADGLPGDTLAAIRANLPQVVEHVLDAVAAENPEYAAVLRDPAGLGIRMGIEQAIRTFLDAIERGEAPAVETDEMWRRLGEAEFQAGRSLEALRSAFRTGTRAVWRSAAEIAIEVGVEGSAVVGLAEGVFTYSETLAADVAEGYRRIQSDEAGERERRRRHLAGLLLDPGGHEREAIERAAEPARWPLPRTLAVLALAGDSPAAVARGLDVDVLAGGGADGSWLVIPDPRGPGRLADVRRAVQAAEVVSALGPAVPPADAHRSLRWARSAIALVATGTLPDQRPTLVEDHLGTMVVHGDPELAALLSRRRLAPVLDLGETERERLLATLRAWLDHQRHVPRVAAELHVHPQTVRYRLGKLRELLGQELDEPSGRFELELALRAGADPLPATASNSAVSTGRQTRQKS